MDSDQRESVTGNTLRNSTILSAKELFECRKRDNLSVPQRGGAKDYEPDGSWLQDKILEAFYEEYHSVLAEPRVEKSGNLVKGTWNSEKGLVCIEKTAKFWMKMGFVDQQRNWLHPEEALFLLEVNCLDLMHNGLSLSVQEAYDLLLHPTCGISEEEYQVYAHLRRLGFIVIRHVGKLDLTVYERKIGLDKHTKKKSKKKSTSSLECDGDKLQSDLCSNTSSVDSKLMSLDTETLDRNGQRQGEILDSTGRQTSQSNVDSYLRHTDQKTISLQADESGGTIAEKTKTELLSPQSNTQIHGKTQTADSVECKVATEEPPLKKMRLGDQNSERTNTLPAALPRPDGQGLWTALTQQSLVQQSSAALSSWDFSMIPFPDIGGKETVSLPIPPSHLIPPNTGVSEEYEDVCMFDVEDYRQQPQHLMQDEDEFGHLKHLQFSYADWYRRHSRPLSARNWREWKAELRHREENFLNESPVAHLWQGEVTPLVKPRDAVSTASLLSKLSVVQPFKGPFPQNITDNGLVIPAVPDKRILYVPDSLDSSKVLTTSNNPGAVKISFDVYLPNTTFKKSRPGFPDHRVCIARGEHPPDVFEVHAAIGHLADNVPLHWAVVRSGEISFFVFDDIDIPVHPSSLG